MKKLILSIIIGLYANSLSALISFECGKYKIVGSLQQNDIIIYPDSISEKTLKNIITNEQIETLQKKGANVDSPVVVTIQIKNMDKAGVPKNINTLAVDIADRSQLLNRFDESAVNQVEKTRCED